MASHEPTNSWSGLQQAPSLPMAVYTSTVRWNPERIRALALYCSDGRWGEAFDEFCHRQLLIPRYDRLAVPGGPAWLVPAEGPNELQKVAKGQIEFLVRVHQLDKIVLITHYGCAFYTEWLKEGPDQCLHAQMEDLRTAADTLRSWFHGIDVETYLAMRAGVGLSFHQIDS